MKRTLVFTILAFGLASAAHAADIVAGRKLSETCVACHGQDGKSPIENYPKLAGQYSDYLEKALNDYSTGARKNPIMGGIANPLTKSDIKNLAAYFASLPGDFTHRR